MTQATTETTFNIGDYEDKHKEPATWNQVRGLSFKQAHDLFQKKSLPKLYREMIDAYLAEQE